MHGLLRPEAEEALAGVDHILHAGDIGRLDVLATLRRFAPVTAVRANVDVGDWAEAYSDTELVRLGGRSIYVLHDLKTLRIDPTVERIDVIVSGHSQAAIQTTDGIIYRNPGSAGSRRFNCR
jgi:uncharacterized protein